MVDILKNAATYEGGLDRGNIMLAARNIHETNPLLIDGLTSITDGTKDAYLDRGRPDGQVHGQRPKAARHVRAGRRPDRPRGPARHLRDGDRTPRLGWSGTATSTG